ncbi:plasmid mobilization protein [Lysobacter changpingensis]|uniref:plasmid mobilization protein n=1 Tax=Lysobacter changpingensis TaxID=2792784 RepID=UPI003CCD959A
MARPPLPESERRTEVLQLRLTKGERKDLDEGAEASGEQVSEFIRTAALEKAKRVKKKAGEPNQG